MALEHNDVPRFTPEQRDEILSLANRLQAQHEGTVGTEELVRVAQEAGIDPRFVHEAAMRVGRKSRRAPSAALVAFLIFTIQALCSALAQRHWERQNSDPFDLPTLAGGFFLALALGFWAARDRSVRRFAPLAALAVWTTLWIASTAYDWAFRPYGPSLPSTAVAYALFQTVTVFMGAALSASLDSAPEGTKTFRLYRRPRV